MLSRLFLMAMALVLWVPAWPQTQPQLQTLFFTGVVGGDEEFGRRVLLRWETLDGVVDLETAVLFRTDALNNRVKVAVVKRTRDANLIASIFYRPGESRILDDARETLERIYGTAGDTKPEFAQRVIDMLDGQDQSEYAGMRRNFAKQANYGFAQVEGRAYLDFVTVSSGPFVYELWQGDAAGNPVDALGRITINPAQVVKLPAPANLVEVFLRGRDGVAPARANNRRIYLNWESSTDLRQYASTTFGYNIYKLPRVLAANEDFEDVQNELVRVNRTPILEPSPIEGEDPDQTYIFADDGEWLQTEDDNDLLPVGATYTYWVVARDLMGTEGFPSLPLQATVRDTEEPDAPPRGLGVVESKDENRTPFLDVMWNPMTADVKNYRVYRYREYSNAGKKGPFPPIDGLTEGFIAEVPAPANLDSKIHYSDFAVNQAPYSTGFWYAASALDAHGNESALSPAVYGVIEDVLGPDMGRVTQFCVSRPILQIDATRTEEAGTRAPTWSPRFVVRRTHPAVARVEIQKVYVTPGRATTVVPLTVLEFENDDVLQFTYTEEGLINQAGIPIYRFIGEGFDGQRVQTDEDPPAAWASLSPQNVYTAVVSVARFSETCNPFGPGILLPGIVPVIPTGDSAPFKIDIDCQGDVATYRLYRSVDGCKSYELVSEVPCDGGPLQLADNYHPEALTEVCYSIVAADKSGNQGTPTYLSPTFVYVGDFPRPTLIEASATGLAGNPTASIRWIGPRAGVQYYRVRFRSEEDGVLKAIEYRISDITYDETLNEFSIATNTVDRLGALINVDRNYEVEVEAVTISQTSKKSDRLPFSWSTQKLNGNQGPGELRWAARPLPLVSPLTTDIIFSGEMGAVTIRLPQLTGLTDEGFELFYSPGPPFMVWRQRTDKAGQPWIAVSPLINEISYAGKFLADGFFALLPVSGQTSAEAIHFVDNSGLVEGATYRYVFMEFDKATKEIRRVHGPISVDIVLPG